MMVASACLKAAIPPPTGMRFILPDGLNKGGSVILAIS